jgi:hypothetical protein
MQTLDTPTPSATLQASRVQQVGAPATAARRPIAREGVLCCAALLTAGVAVIHLSGAPQQLPRSTIIATGLALFGLAQLVTAAALVAVPSRTVVRAPALLNAGSAAVWVLAHSFGPRAGADHTPHCASGGAPSRCCPPF